MYAIRYKGTKNRSLYYVSHGWYQDSRDSAATKVFRTIFLADARMFADRQEAEEAVKDLNIIHCGNDCTIEYITNTMFEEAERHKFRETLAGNYIASKG